MQDSEKQRLTKLKIEHYRGFFDEQSFNFGIPAGKPGSGLTLVVGPNNAGKTSVLEALLQMRQDNLQKFRQPDRHENNKPKINICFENSSHGRYRVAITNQGKGSYRDYTIYNDNGEIANIPAPNLEAVASRRHWSIVDDLSRYGTRDFPEYGNQVTNYMKLRQATGDSLTFRKLGSIRDDKDKKQRLDDMLKTLIPGFTDWDIDTGSDNQDYLEYVTSKGAHRADLLGDGTLSLFRICLHLMDDKPDEVPVLIIDEPELSLHPVAQSGLARLISESSANKQIIVCTHSPYFVNWNDYKNGAKFVRLNKIDDGRCVISELKKPAKYTPSLIKEEWMKPQLMDTVAKEIMFANSILFVEGQEDVGLIRKWLAKNRGGITLNIFGYGAGGFQKIEKLLAMAKDLRIGRVAALYDGGASESEAIAKARKKFLRKEGFRFFQLPTEDIRDKNRCSKCDKKCDCKCKRDGPRGCFDKLGNLKTEHEESFEEIMTRIIDYLVTPSVTSEG